MERYELGNVAVDAHTDAMRNGQETEPFETQAVDAITNILHAVRRHKNKALARKTLELALMHFEHEG